jgi:hypothetical protein
MNKLPTYRTKSLSSPALSPRRDKSGIASSSSVGRGLSTLIVLNTIEGANQTMVSS